MAGQLELPFTSTDAWEKYADWVEEATNPSANKFGIIYPLAGLATEGGECGAYVEKYLRKGGFIDIEQLDSIVLELGDIYYYFTLACRKLGVKPEYIAERNKRKLIARQLNGK